MSSTAATIDQQPKGRWERFIYYLRNDDRIVPAIWVIAACSVAIMIPVLGIVIVAFVACKAVDELIKLLIKLFSKPSLREGLSLVEVAGLLGVLYIICGCGALIWPIQHYAGWKGLSFILVLTFACDTAAYAGGKAIARINAEAFEASSGKALRRVVGIIGKAQHKLAPKVSPGKTWAGLWCEIATGFLVAEMYYAGGWRAMGGAWIFFWAPFLSLVGAGGDLLESWFKRLAGEKDSGKILKGMGGMLDRIDGLMPISCIGGVLVLANLLR